MFGVLRFLLAYLVILSHLVGTDYVAHFGFYAVRGFFVISGLLMTAALNEAYAFDHVFSRRVKSAFGQLGAIIVRDQFDSCRQVVAVDILDFGADALKHFERIFTAPHDHDPHRHIVLVRLARDDLADSS